MLVTINYDLVSKVKIANGSLVKPTMESIVKVLPWFSTLLLIYNIKIGRSLVEIINKTAIGIGITTLIVGPYIAVNALMDKEENKRKAFNDLKSLSFKLTNQGIETSDILLLDSVQDGFTKYRFRFNEGKFQDILQEKYILIPSYYDGKVKNIEVLQEHVIEFPPNDEYTLTLGSRSRKKVYKPAFNSNL